MTYNFSEAKKQSELLEKELQVLKSEYQKQEMPTEQAERLRKKMKEVRNMEKNKKNRKRFIKMAAVAHAMEQIPIIGPLVEIVTFRDYEYETDRNKADIEVPEIKPVEMESNGAEDREVQEKLDKTAEEINAEIQKITDDLRV